MKIDIDEIAGRPANQVWKPEIGESISGTITFCEQTRGPSYDQKRTEEQIRLDLVTDDGEEYTLYATSNTDTESGGYPKRRARAWAAAVRAAGADGIEVGGRIGERRIDNHKTDMGEANDYESQYEPPRATAADTGGGSVSNLLAKS